jgi:ADP-heptose:LPS heptosyltransferase
LTQLQAASSIAVLEVAVKLVMRILVIRPGALGDVLLTLPALQALSAAFPQASIELMGNLAVVQWLPGRSVVQTVSSFDRADLAALFQPEVTLAVPLQEYLDSFDFILSYATAPEHVFARNLARLARGQVLLLDARPPIERAHLGLYLQQPLSGLGLAPDTGYPRLHLTATDRQAAAEWWEAHALGDAPVVAIHPGSGSPAKNWPAVRFAALASHLRRERGVRVLLISGPADDAAAASVRRCLAEPDSALPRGPSASLGQEQNPILLHNPPSPLLAAILSRCRLYVGNDSGVSHLAAALGVPVVVIFGPTDPEVWAPRGPVVHILHTPTACAPCAPPQRQTCQERACLERVSLQMVLDAIAMALATHDR